MLRGIYRNLDRFYYFPSGADFHYFRCKDVSIQITTGNLGNFYELFYHTDDDREIEVNLNMFEKIYFKFICKKLMKMHQQKYKNAIRKEITY